MSKSRFSWLKKLTMLTVMVMTLVAPTAQALTAGTAPDVVVTSVAPNPFDPKKDGVITIDYVLQNESGNVHIEILQNNVVISNLLYPTNKQVNDPQEIKWDGIANSNYVPASSASYSYKYRITAENLFGSDVAEGPITIVYNTTPPTDTTAPVIYLVSGVGTPAYDTTPDFIFNTNEIGSILYGGSCSSSTTVAPVVGNNTITLNNLAPGTYSNCTVQVRDAAGNLSNIIQLPSFTILTTGGNTCISNITSHYATRTEFDPDTETTSIVFTLDKTADDVIIEILDGSQVVREIIDNMKLGAGTHSFSWDGEDDANDVVSDGFYTYRIKTNVINCGTDTETGTVEVDSDVTNNDGEDDDNFEDDFGDLIDNIYVDNAVFDPTENERARLNFDVLEDNVDITVEVIRFRNVTNRVIRTLIDGVEYDESDGNSSYWNGKDQDNDTVNDDVYVFRIRAEKGTEDEVAYRYTEVDTDGIIIGFPGDDDEYCAGFIDVPKSNPYCKAIELMKLKGIFTGYPDGTFGLYKPINRAETTKVTLLAIGISILNDDGTNLGFWDVVKKAWYMTYLRTAKTHGIIRGYPDGAFRPDNMPNRVELLKIFLETTGINIPYCNNAPFVDTPVNAETRWYIDYVCFAANNGLMYGDGAGRFNPATPMNRGDVAMLFYNFYVRGMDSQINHNLYNYNYTPYNYTTQYYYY